MGCKTKIQLIERKTSEQWYLFFPMAIARALELEKGEEFEIVIKSADEIVLRRAKEGGGSKKTKTRR